MLHEHLKPFHDKISRREACWQRRITSPLIVKFSYELDTDRTIEDTGTIRY